MVYMICMAALLIRTGYISILFIIVFFSVLALQFLMITQVPDMAEEKPPVPSHMENLLDPRNNQQVTDQ